MKTIAILSFLFVVATTGLYASGSGSNRQTRPVKGFHGISVSTGIDLYLTQKNVEEVVVEADSDNLDKIITEVEGGILKIYIKEKSFLNFNLKQSTRKVYVSFREIDQLFASAGSDVVSESPVKLDRLSLDASSGSDVRLELEASEINVESSSASDVTLKGKTNVFRANASSGSDITASDLYAQKCFATSSSGSDIRVYASDELTANASSGSDITYLGNPAKKDINESSGGDVHGK